MTANLAFLATKAVNVYLFVRSTANQASALFQTFVQNAKMATLVQSALLNVLPGAWRLALPRTTVQSARLAIRVETVRIAKMDSARLTEPVNFNVMSALKDVLGVVLIKQTSVETVCLDSQEKSARLANQATISLKINPDASLIATFLIAKTTSVKPLTNV